MTKKKTSILKILSLVLVLMIVSAFVFAKFIWNPYLYPYFFPNQYIKSVFIHHRDQITELGDEFNRQSLFEEIHINSAGCTTVNGRRLCHVKSKDFDYIISEEKAGKEYKDIVRKLNLMGLKNIAKVKGCEDCIDFEYVLSGIRYSPKGNILSEDDEFLFVERLSEDYVWYQYRRDWN